MNGNTHSTEEFDSALYREKSNRFLWTENLEPYYDKQVAWSLDGTQILASGNSHEELYENLRKADIPATSVVVGYIPDPNVGNI